MNHSAMPSGAPPDPYQPGRYRRGKGPHRGHECPSLQHLDPGQLGAVRCDCPVPGRPVGYLALPGKLTKHRCAPPVLRDPCESAAAAVGAVWRCPCGRLWTVYRLAQAGTGQHIASPFDRRWRRAGLLLRWRYRDARPALPAEVDAVPQERPQRPPRPPRGTSGVSGSSSTEPTR